MFGSTREERERDSARIKGLAAREFLAAHYPDILAEAEEAMGRPLPRDPDKAPSEAHAVAWAMFREVLRTRWPAVWHKVLDVTDQALQDDKYSAGPRT